jgi:alpha-N-arabinofuranosidase
VLDLIEWANGPADSEWGAKRAAAGHPEPFNLEYLGIGNEDHITPAFEERFRMINDALKEKHPEITVIGTVGPAPGGPDYEQGWRIANDLHLTMVDEHYYQTPKWFLENLQRYDAYDRKKSQVYLGEFAAHDDGRKETLRSALAEAAYMTHLERNGDIVRLASYAPLLGKRGRTQWNPDLIYFTNTTVRPTINYYVQQMFSANSGDHYVPAEIKSTTDEAPRNIQVSCVRDSATDDVILRLVNLGEPTQQVHVKLATKGEVDPNAKCTVLSGDPLAENGFGKHEQLVPKSRAQLVDKEFVYDTPGNSLSVIRIRQAKR